ncbi:MAG: hypothetical protein IKN91_08725 [Paludibacteraceae bacterium]|nr:hypothetical protein [Paludibacteraceae bacterium]
MKKKTIIIIIAIIAAVVVLAVYLIRNKAEKQDTVDDEHPTDAVYDYAVRPADAYLVGLWREASNPLWFKAYYDDYADDGYYLGKEWQENEGVFEEDLSYHGNGWFKWKRDGNKMIEFHVLTMSKVLVPKRWNVIMKRCEEVDSKAINLTVDSLILTEQEYSKNQYHFARVEK